jgi:hypothetical protein
MQLSLTNYPATKVESHVDFEKKSEEPISNKFLYGQYNTKQVIVERLIKLIQEYKSYAKDAAILEPSFGTGNFIKVLKENEFKNITGCEIDPALTPSPVDFFHYSLENKFDLIVGNPPFTKYNIFDSYYQPKKYANSRIQPDKYLTKGLQNKEKEKIENVFILKCLQHLRNNSSTIAFVLPISFFIKNRNKEIKQELMKKFSTVIIFQNKDVWFDYHIPCCFAIFTNAPNFENKIILHYENGENNIKILDLAEMNEELIPETVFNKAKIHVEHSSGDTLKKYLSTVKIQSKKSFSENNVSAKNILERRKIPEGSDIAQHKLAVVRVGNSSVGKCGFINIDTDILNDMFYLFDFNEEFNNNKELKEKICDHINQNQDYFKTITCRVGSKSIKKEDVLNFRCPEGEL